LAVIDGQAGTGKSFTIAAVREAYEAAGYRVIGLGPTNAVAQDMSGDGFAHAATIHSELFALNNGRRSWNGKTVVIVDEAAFQRSFYVPEGVDRDKIAADFSKGVLTVTMPKTAKAVEQTKKIEVKSAT
jgi:nucleoside-triphosphatase THEP1